MKGKESEEFKKEAVRLVLTSGKTQKQIAHDLGVSQWAISTWKKDYAPEKVGNEDLKAAADVRIRELEKENALLRQEREILKKAMGIVSKQ
jgi:transposase